MIKNADLLSYYEYSKDVLTSLIFISPLLILYEMLAYFIFNNANFVIRNSADVYIRNFFEFIGFSSNILLLFVIIIVILLYVLLNQNKYKNYTFNYKYYICMYFEGIILGGILLLFLNGYKFIHIYSFEYYESYYMYFYYCLGAGIWEELLFRLIIFNFSVYIISFFFNIKIAQISSVIISSILFSAIHYIGVYSDVFTMSTFIIRFVGGVFLCLIYIKRGIGISCMSHYSYDVMLLTIPFI